MDDKELKMMLLEKLMGEMDESSMGKFKKKEMEPMVAVEKVESQAMPISDLKDKLMGKKDMEEESPDMMAMEMDMEGGDEDEEEDMDDMSPFMQKMMELKKAKKLGKM